MTKYVQKPKTPVPQSAPATKAQVRNSAGGYVFDAGCWTRLERFLILGSESNTYYATAPKLIEQSAEAVMMCAKQDIVRTLSRISTISKEGRAPKNDPAIFALALITADHTLWSNPGVVEILGNTFRDVCRISTHVFSFVNDVNHLKGYRRAIRKIVASWYNSKTGDDLAYQMVKYFQRNGWSHKDVLRLSHVKPVDKHHQALYRWATKDEYLDDLPRLVHVHRQLTRSTSETEVVSLIKDNRAITWEMVPTQFLKSPKVWEALLPNMPLTAMVRNLGRMTSIGLIKPLSNAASHIQTVLSSGDYIHKSRLHPLVLLNAGKQYAAGHGDKGSLTWSPVGTVTDAIEAGFYLAFNNVAPTNKRTLLAVDISGSMSCGAVGGMSVTPREASMALAMVTARTEPNHYIMAFGTRFQKVDVGPKDSLRTILRTTDAMGMQGTDCALPMVWAKENKIDVDTFVIYTDNETWYGKIHPFEALKQYRQSRSINSKLVVCGMTANKFSIADPNDAGSLDIVGFDTAVPELISMFSQHDVG